MSQRCTTCMRLLRKSLGRSSHTLRFTGVQGRFLDFARNDDAGKALLSFSACLRRISPLSFIPPVPYPPLWGTFPSRGRLWVWGSGILVSPPSPWREGSWTSPSFLWKEVPRRGGGWLPQRDEGEYTIVRPPVSSSRVQPRDLSCRRENSTYEEVRHSKSYEVRCLPLSHIFCLTSVQGRFLDFARNDDTGKALLSFFACLRRISPLVFISRVPYPPLRGTFPSRGRLWVWGSGILVSPPSPWREGSWTSPSFLWKEVPRRGGGWLPQRDEGEYTIVRPPVSSSRVQPRDLSCRRENSTYEEVRHSKSYEVRCLPLSHIFCLTSVQGRFLDIARNDDTGKAIHDKRRSPLHFSFERASIGNHGL